MTTYNYVQGDTGPQLQLTLTEMSTGSSYEMVSS